METTETQTHPLLQKEFRGIRDWKTWKELWDQARYDTQLLTLLHGAFDVECYKDESSERLCFLLRIADGHGSSSTYWPRDPTPVANQLEREDRARHAEACRPIAKKAFQVLCDRYFKRFLSRDSSSVTSGLPRESYEALLWFFGDDARHPYGRNLPRADDDSHHAQAARAYVSAFVRGSWPRQYSQHGRTAEEEEACRQTRVRYVALLNDLRELEFLYEDKDYADEAAVEALRRYALFDRAGAQVFRDAEEAVGTYAGRCLLVLEATVREAARKRRVTEAERKQREAQDDLEAARKS